MSEHLKSGVFALLALAISAFAIGTTEFISVGLLPLISRDLHVPVTTAGLTVSLYAFGVMIGAPVLTALTSNLPRKTLLFAVMLVFILGNAVAAVSTSLWLLLAARMIAAFSHGVFMSVGATTAAALVPEGRRAGAISILFSGLTVAIIAGVPFGTYLGLQIGWRAGFGQSAIAVILLEYGIAVAIGNVVGGKVANRRPLSALVLIFMAQTLVLALLSFAFAADSKTAVLAVVFLMGLMAFMSASGLQLYVVILAERFVPAAVDVASAVNITAFNASILIGSYLGGLITDSIGITYTAWGGALMVLGAIVLTGWMKALERKDHAGTSDGAATSK